MLRTGAQHGNVSCLRLEGADNQPRPSGQCHIVQPENVERSTVAAAGDGRNSPGVGCRFEDNLEDIRRRSRRSKRGLSSRRTGIRLRVRGLAESYRRTGDSGAFRVEMAMSPSLLSKSSVCSTASTAGVASATFIRHLLSFSASELDLLASRIPRRQHSSSGCESSLRRNRPSSFIGGCRGEGHS